MYYESMNLGSKKIYPVVTKRKVYAIEQNPRS